MTFQRKLFLGFCLMVVPVVLVGAAALRSNREERAALEALGESMARSRTFAELETAMFNQSEEIWQFLTGMEPQARRDFQTIETVIDYWQSRWESELKPDEMDLARDIERIHQQMIDLSERIFALSEAGDREAAYRLAEQELKGRILPELTRKNREIYGATRERSVKRTYARLEEGLANERRALFSIFALSLLAGVGASILISRGLARPIRELTSAMAVAGEGRLDQPIEIRSKDEIGDLARAFAGMTEKLKRSHEALAGLNADLEAKIAQLEQTQAQLIHSEKLASIGEMSAAVAHGLRNPLASLSAAAQLALHQMQETPAAREHLKTIIAEVDRLDRRIGHLLSFSRPAPFRPHGERLSHVVAAILPAFAGRLSGQKIHFVSDVPEDLPEVRVDPFQLEQALVEILSNALDAMTAGGRLTIRGYRAPGADAAERVVIEVSDTGEGIAEDVLPSVCDPFFTTRAEGTGLGLATAKRYVAQNGGTFEIASARGSGTTVRILLPVDVPSTGGVVSEGKPAAGSTTGADAVLPSGRPV